MIRSRRGPLLWAYWCLLLVGGIAAQALLIANHATWHQPTDPVGVGTVFAITYGTAGMLIVQRRPGNSVGRVFVYVATVAVVTQLSGEYAVFAYLTAHASLPLRALSAWISGWTFFLAFPAGLSLVFLLFPDGIGRGWWPRVVVAVALGAMVALTASFLLAAGPIAPSDRVGNLTVPVDNATGVLSVDAANVISSLGWAASGLALIASVLSAVRRLRRSQGERHQQLRWFAYFAAPVAPAFLVHYLILGAGLPIPDFGFPVYYLVFLVGIPVATGIALLKYRLYDLDVVVSRALVYGALAVMISAVYVAIAVGIGAVIGGGGRPNLGLSILATAIVAVGFQPLRERLQRVANRLVYGRRATPYEVLSEFSERVAGSYAMEEVLPEMARVLAQGTGAQRADVWLRSGEWLRPAAGWPADAAAQEPVALTGSGPAPAGGADRLVAVRHQGEVLGALSVSKRTGETLTPVEESLLEHLAGQAGLVLKNVGLTADLQARLEELRASRKRLVGAQDRERRRLERNLHDGAQQHLVAIKVKLGLVQMLVDKQPERARATLAQVKDDADEALETLRDLARGIYPPLLADRGLAAALLSQAGKATVPVTVEAEGVERYPQDVEAAVYFCCLEALQNVQKYACAGRVVIRLSAADGQLGFEVEDDGVGFDPATTKRGSGLANMVDRLDALGGEMVVTSAPGQGTRLHGSLPVAVAVAVAS